MEPHSQEMRKVFHHGLWGKRYSVFSGGRGFLRYKVKLFFSLLFPLAESCLFLLTDTDKNSVIC